jgi:predicted ABC-type exoprotein transport system permease subunit
MLVGTNAWPHQGARRVFTLVILFGVAHAIYSEWMNTTIRASWSYGPLMPVVPWIGTGLSPLVQRSRSASL